jgi:hypothetical protein
MGGGVFSGPGRISKAGSGGESLRAPEAFRILSLATAEADSERTKPGRKGEIRWGGMGAGADWERPTRSCQRSVGTVLGRGMGMVTLLPPGHERRGASLPNRYHTATTEYLSLYLILTLQNLQKRLKVVAYR